MRISPSCVEIFSLDLEEGVASIEFNSNSGGYSKFEDVPIKNDSVLGSTYFGLLQPYIDVQNGWGTIVTVTQGEKKFTIDASNFKYFDQGDCMWSKYYYAGNKVLGYWDGC